MVDMIGADAIERTPEPTPPPIFKTGPPIAAKSNSSRPSSSRASKAPSTAGKEKDNKGEEEEEEEELNMDDVAQGNSPNVAE
jgi:hypothetical protein